MSVAAGFRGVGRRRRAPGGGGRVGGRGRLPPGRARRLPGERRAPWPSTSVTGSCAKGCAAASTAAATSIMTRCSWLVPSQAGDRRDAPPHGAHRAGHGRPRRPRLPPGRRHLRAGLAAAAAHPAVGRAAGQDTTSLEAWTLFAVFYLAWMAGAHRCCSSGRSTASATTGSRYERSPRPQKKQRRRARATMQAVDAEEQATIQAMRRREAARGAAAARAARPHDAAQTTGSR